MGIRKYRLMGSVGAAGTEGGMLVAVPWFRPTDDSAKLRANNWN
jgi:hypothetical protein